MKILQQINETVNAVNKQHQIVSTNIDIVLEKSTDLTADQLNEAVTNWLARLRGAAEKGNVDPSKKQGIAYVLGALMALSDPNIADALDERNDLGTMLYAVSSDNKEDSKAALQRLVQIGRHPSLKSYVAQASETLDNPDTINQVANQLQTKIDQVMRSKLSKERQTTQSNQAQQTTPKLGLKDEMNKQQ